ncbi:unnamed protein product [Strongylus vulgaris]|uniref:Uncharacterized protein n=1 Tax=Strongylus vulgaris TaxID=40348 RepID=A0A3P7J0H1_STRVU|nr:unnamed protein product [Strongylus vulgaris]
MLLVMASTGLFASVPGLHQMTVSRMGNVLPQLIRDTLPATPPPIPPAQPEPTSLTSVASASRVGGRVHIAPAIPSPSEESLPSTTSAPQPATAFATESTPSAVVPPHHPNDPVHSNEQPAIPATVPVNIPLVSQIDHLACFYISSWYLLSWDDNIRMLLQAQNYGTIASNNPGRVHRHLYINILWNSLHFTGSPAPACITLTKLVPLFSVSKMFEKLVVLVEHCVPFRSSL